MSDDKKRKRQLIMGAVLLLGANVLFCFTLWLLSKYDDVNFDQILFQAKSSTEGAHRILINSAALRVGVLGVLLTALGAAIYEFLSGGFMGVLKKHSSYVRFSGSKFAAFFKRKVVPLALVMVLLSLGIFIGELDVMTYAGTVFSSSDFIENHYVDPAETSISFPEEKRNLVYIILESMETTYGEPEAGGPIKADYMPELTQLAEENLNFSHDGDFGGASMFTGTSWTAGSLVSQSSGMVIKVPLNADRYGGEDNDFMPGTYSIGEVLRANGYENVMIMGSDADFAGRRTYYTDHGDYKILDTDNLKKDGALPEDYDVWWGYEDVKVFDYAREELTRLSRGDKPFNLTLLTADTHFPDGYLCSKCRNDHEDQYANVVSCSSRQTYEFVEWIKAQDFYENTTIVICGDHLTMDPAFLDGMNEDYVRTTYNCIINPAIEAENSKYRSYGLFDMYPTTLAAMGAEIEGDRLALGTNLFSDKKTLTEIYGYDKLDEELLKHSDFYNDVILNLDEEN